MDIKKLQNGVTTFLQKYKYAVLIVLIGVVLMLIPSTSSETNNETKQETPTIEVLSVQEELEEILANIQGAGRVKVMLKELSGAETVYQTNEDISVSENSSTTKIEVITVTDPDRNEQGLIKQINPPQYLGAIVLCQGADDPSVKLAVADAVSKITGLGTDKIAVLKMK